MPEMQKYKSKDTIKKKREVNDGHINFIRELYRIKAETGNTDYFNCNCVNFPEYTIVENRK